MTDIIFKKMQVLELEGLLKQSASDPVLAPQLRERLDDVRKEIEAELRQAGSLFPREAIAQSTVAILLRGGGVEDDIGIRPSLAGMSLINYERMFVEQAIHDERESAKTAGRQRRPRGAGTPALLFVGTPRGSFGLEFSPAPVDDEATYLVRAKALQNVTEAITAVANGTDADFPSIIAPIPAGVLQHLKSFFRSLATHGAEARLVSSAGLSQQLDSTKITAAAERLDRNVMQGEVKVVGVVRGVTRESGYFDLKVGDEVITGTVAESFSEEQLAALDSLTNSPCVAVLLRTTVTAVSGASKHSYTLLDFWPEGAEPQKGGPAIERSV